MALDEKAMSSAWNILTLNPSKKMNLGRNVSYLVMEGAGDMDWKIDLGVTCI